MDSNGFLFAYIPTGRLRHSPLLRQSSASHLAPSWERKNDILKMLYGAAVYLQPSSRLQGNDNANLSRDEILRILGNGHCTSEKGKSAKYIFQALFLIEFLSSPTPCPAVIRTHSLPSSCMGAVSIQCSNKAAYSAIRGTDKQSVVPLFLKSKKMKGVYSLHPLMPEHTTIYIYVSCTEYSKYLLKSHSSSQGSTCKCEWQSGVKCYISWNSFFVLSYVSLILTCFRLALMSTLPPIAAFPLQYMAATGIVSRHVAMSSLSLSLSLSSQFGAVPRNFCPVHSSSRVQSRVLYCTSFQSHIMTVM